MRQTLRTMPAAAVTVAVLLGAPIAAQQAQPQPQSPQKPATALILGRVVEARSNEPVANAIVMIREPRTELEQPMHDGPSPNQPLAVLTDANGQFLFTGLKAGPYGLHARRNGYEEGFFGQRRPGHIDGTQPIILKDGERRGDVTIRIWKYAAITGTVTDEHGDPIVNVPIRAFVRTFVAGHPRLGVRAGFASTDDRGMFRISRLLPGDYIVGILQSERSVPVGIVDAMKKLESAGDRAGVGALGELLGSVGAYVTPLGTGDSVRVGGSLLGLRPPVIALGADSLLAYPTQFYPGVPGASAARAITVGSGDEIPSIDFQLRPLPTRRVAGMVTDASGPVKRFPVRLLPATISEFEMEGMAPNHSTVTDDEGRFVFPAVIPGDYIVRGLRGVGGGVMEFAAMGAHGSGGGDVVITAGNFSVVSAEAFQPPKPEVTRYASLPVNVADRDIVNLTVGLTNGAVLSGTVEFSNRQDKPDASEFEQLGIVVEAIDGRTIGFDFEMTGKADKDGKFTTLGLPPGRYLVRVPVLPEGWTLDGVFFGGTDVSDRPLDVGTAGIDGITIRLTNRPTTLAGSVTVAPGAKDDLTRAVVFAFPTDRSGWRDYGATPSRLKMTGLSEDGTYQIQSLPPGEYFVVAVRDDFIREWRAPAFLEQLAPLASRVTITRGDRVTRSLTLTSLPAGGR